MLKKLGRLENDDIRQIEALMNDIFNKLETNREEAEAELIDAAKTPNYFVREELGKVLSKYSDQRRIVPLVKRMIGHKFYGVKATGLFYYYWRHHKEPEKILEVLQTAFEDVPWESEAIVNDLWRRYPGVMKKNMLLWVKAENEKQRAISFHGMENLANSDPAYIMQFIGEAIDDGSMEVQKKITHILTQVARSRPAECYPYIREWLLSSDERRMKTIWVSMKKLANIVIQKSRRDKSQEFIMLTHQTINDWKRDANDKVSQMGKKLAGIIHNGSKNHNHNDDNDF